MLLPSAATPRLALGPQSCLSHVIHVLVESWQVTVESPMLPPGGIISNTRECTFSDNLDLNGGQLRWAQHMLLRLGWLSICCWMQQPLAYSELNYSIDASCTFGCLLNPVHKAAACSIVDAVASQRT